MVPMRRSRLILITIGVVAAVTATVVAVSRSRNGSESQLLAFRTSNRLALVADGTIVASVDGRFDSLVWTTNGRYVAGLLPATEGSAAVVAAIDSRTRRISRHPCPDCAGLVAGADARVTTVRTAPDGPAVLVDIDLTTGASQIRAGQLPVVEGWVNPLVQGPQGVLVAAANLADVAAYGGPENLYLVHDDGTVTSLGSTDSNMQIGILTRRAGPDGRVALVGGWHAGACEVAQTISLLDPATGARTATDLSGLLRGERTPGSDAGTEVRDLWWGPDGSLHAILAVHSCGPQAPLVAPSRWRLGAGGRWEPQGAEILTGVRELGDGNRAVLRATGGLRSDEASQLFWVTAEGETRVAGDVLAIETPPQAWPVTTTAAPTVTGTGRPVGAADRLDPARLQSLGVCHVKCVHTGQIDFRHPSWGASTLLTLLAAPDVGTREATIVVVDAAGSVRWQHQAGPWEQLAPADPPRDRTGHLFLNYNPGRLNGVIVLGITDEGLVDFDSLPKPGDYASRFYSAELVDGERDGRYEIDSGINDCDPDCAGGKIHHRIYRWNGTTYA